VNGVDDRDDRRTRRPAATPLQSRSAPAPAQLRSRATSIRLFDPDRLLCVLAVLFWPLKFVPFLLIPAVPLAGLTIYKHWHDLTADLQQMVGDFSFFIHLLVGLLIVNLGVRLSMGVVVRAAGGSVRDFSLTLYFGIFPRFYVDRSAIPQLDRNGQLWAYGAPLLVRLGFFAFGTLAWATYRSGGTWAANLALLISQTGLWAFLFSIMPFLPLDGYNWLVTYFRQPRLYQKALIALNAKLRGRRLPRGISRGEVPMLIAFAVCALIAIFGLAFALLIVLGTVLTERFQGLGAVLFLVVMAGFVIWLLRLRAMLGPRKQQPREIRVLQAMVDSQANASEAAPVADRRRWQRRLLIAAAGAVVLIAAAFLPYSYDPAGPFEILPTQRSEAVARTDGEVVNIMVREGDWVNAGQVLARLSSSDQRRDVALARQALARAEARLAEIEKTRSNPDEANAERGADAGAVDLRREAARSEVERLRHRLDSQQAQLDHTAIRAPSAGVVSTPNAQLLMGTWLHADDAFLRIDDTTNVEAEIAIPQGDIVLIKPGATVRLRPWSERDREIVGQVTGLAPTALGRPADGGHAATGHEPPTAPADQADDSGIVRVKASVPNAGALLRPAMTGYAKINGQEMTVGEAYLRLFIRFLTVEVWSWAP
jgi:multidrug efflux pump subunit AcrA (membrane-fusion protein)